jgi:hypothetical protein
MRSQQINEVFILASEIACMEARAELKQWNVERKRRDKSPL